MEQTGYGWDRQGMVRMSRVWLEQTGYGWIGRVWLGQTGYGWDR